MTPNGGTDLVPKLSNNEQWHLDTGGKVINLGTKAHQYLVLLVWWKPHALIG